MLSCCIIEMRFYHPLLRMSCPVTEFMYKLLAAALKFINLEYIVERSFHS